MKCKEESELIGTVGWEWRETGKKVVLKWKRAAQDQRSGGRVHYDSTAGKCSYILTITTVPFFWSNDCNCFFGILPKMRAWK